MTELANQHFATFTITDYIRDHQWIIETTRRKTSGERAIYTVSPHRFLIKHNGKKIPLQWRNLVDTKCGRQKSKIAPQNFLP